MSSPAIKRPQMRFKTKQNNASKRSLEQLPGYITTQAFNQYRCAKIIEEREVTTKEYRTRWSGYGSDHDTWLLETAFVNNLALEEWNQTKQAEQLPAREQSPPLAPAPVPARIKARRKRGLKRKRKVVGRKPCPVFEVDEIVDEREVTKKQYRCRWTAYDSQHDTW